MRKALILIAALPWMVAASPIAGGPCGGSGTLAEFVAIGDVGCFLLWGERIYDIQVSLPTPVDLSTFLFGGPDSYGWYPPYSEATAHFIPAGATITVHWDAPRPTIGDWYQFDRAGNLTTTSFSNLYAEPGVIVMRATIPDAYLGFRITQLAPEPSAFLPLVICAALLLKRRYGVRNSPSR